MCAVALVSSRHVPLRLSIFICAPAVGAKAHALIQEMSALLDKGAIEPVDPLSPPRGFYSTYCLVAKKDGRLRPTEGSGLLQ